MYSGNEDLSDLSDIGLKDEELDKILDENRLKIRIIGVGGAGSNTINKMSEKNFESDVADIRTIAVNTDAVHLKEIRANKRFVIGKALSRGRGAGADPSKGEQAARESVNEIDKALEGSKITVIVAGMGGGTGTGAAPFIASRSKKAGSLAIGICSWPLKGEGKVREENARLGLTNFVRAADSVILFQNDEIVKLVPNDRVDAALAFADSIMMQAIEGIIDSVTRTTQVNTEMSDLEKVMSKKGIGTFGVGVSDSPAGQRVQEAFDQAMNSPFSNLKMEQARAMLISITGGEDLRMNEQTEAMELARQKIGRDAIIIPRLGTDRNLTGKIKILVFATGIPTGYDNLVADDSDFSVNSID
ncbi:MAG: cell division FtsZ family protein [Candidatus Thermoplasmatota archaeon]|jgi:cell division protein FtsZ|nr:cell division FtsZ family protein [Candidatus Thermoplasmatota archaeon]MCL5790865.1 cell division FtsZ family protein [Candidatus Thermoplasmatota archaeon]